MELKPVYIHPFFLELFFVFVIVFVFVFEGSGMIMG